MVSSDFPAWYSASVFGGIGCALLSALTIAAWALWRRRGATGQAILALLVCVVASALDIGPLLWIEYRLGVYGPTLRVAEVALALLTAALIGWVAPLATLCSYLLMARPVPLAAAPAVTSGPVARGAIAPAALDDPDRDRPAFADGQPWGSLTPVGAPADSLTATPVRAIPLTRRLTLIGREADNDIVVEDERISRRHAEIRWERGRVELADYGSLNGTLVNEQAVRGRLLLRGGDLIQLGKRRYQLVLRPAEATAVAVVASPDEADADREMEQLETRKTARMSDSQTLIRPALRLVAFQGTGAGGSWPLAAAVTTIGRDQSCAVVVPDTSISRMHAQVTRQPAGYFIADLESSNGVWLNGERLTGPAQIAAGDVIALGDTLLRCEADTTTGASGMGAPSTPSTSADAPPAPPLTPTGAPEFHLRIAPEWSARARSRPRLAPPRLRPSDSHESTSPAE